MAVKSPTIHDVAVAAGVSIATVSRVVNGKGGVNQDLTRRVQDAIAACGYVPDNSARNLRGSKKDSISIILPTVRFSDILRGVVDEAFEKGLRLSIYASNGSVERDIACLQRVASSGTGGLIYCPTSKESVKQLGLVTDRGIPVTIAALRNLAPGCPHIYTDHIDACYRATKFLLRHGHRRIAFFAGFWEDRPAGVDDLLGMLRSKYSGVYAALDRLAGYRLALEEFGVELDKSLIFITGFEYDDGYCVCKKAIAELCDFDAMMCPTDRMAAGALQALQEQNISVPQQVSVIGYDDGIFAESTRPTLTAIHQLSYTVGQESVRALSELMSGNPVEDKKLDAELIVRTSTAAKNQITG